MALRVGFEPTVQLPVLLISSQVHSTKLCHLSMVVRLGIEPRFEDFQSPT